MITFYKQFSLMSKVFDLFIIGGGINGAGIARDASGKGLSVCLADKEEKRIFN